MNDYLPFIFSGLVSGAIYGLAGTGLVLTYKTSGVFNFAYGALATVSAFLFYTLHVQHNVPWPVAAAICLVLIGPAMRKSRSLECSNDTTVSRSLSATS